MYSVDWQKFVRFEIPHLLRKPKMLAFLYALISPLIFLHNRFLAFRLRKLEGLMITPQVRVMQFWLNRYFDPTEQRIEIKDAANVEPIYVFLESENRPVYLQKFLSGRSVDFEVCLPNELLSSQTLIIGFLNSYKLASKRYRIVYPDGANGGYISVDAEPTNG